MEYLCCVTGIGIDLLEVQRMSVIMLNALVFYSNVTSHFDLTNYVMVKATVENKISQCEF